MKLVEQSHEIIRMKGRTHEFIEEAGRTCYKSEDKITADSAKKFIAHILERGHESVIEHESVSVRFITNRGVTHEMVRHRLASYSQESTRYVNYGGKQMEFIKPVWWDEVGVGSQRMFAGTCTRAEAEYNVLLSMGWRPEMAREVLPNALKTEIVMSCNLREWRHVFNLRCSKHAHPQMRALMRPCLETFQRYYKVFFDDVSY